MGAKVYTIIPQGGLCNRMRSLDAALALAAATGRELVVQWDLDRGLNCRFEMLFEIPAGVARIDTRNHTGRFAKQCKTITKRLNRLRYDLCLYEHDLARYAAKHPDLAALDSYGSVLIASCQRFYGAPPHYTSLRPTAENRAEIDRLIARFATNTIGIHIRRTDHVHAIAKSPTERFIATMEQAVRQDADVRFFVATDSPKTEQELIERFPGRIITHPKRSLDRSDAVAIQDALVDVYGLAACTRIFGSVDSSFSETAAQLGRIPLQMITTEWSKP